MTLEQLKETIGEYGRDIRLNLSSVLTEEGAPGLSATQLWGVAIASAYSTRNSELIQALVGEAKVTPEVVEAAKGAATLMAMNNVYYRTIHLAEDKEFSKMPARLRMNLLGKPGVPKLDFELMSLAVSAINGCGACVNAHVAEAKKGGISNEGVQSTIRISAVISAAAQAVEIR